MELNFKLFKFNYIEKNNQKIAIIELFDNQDVVILQIEKQVITEAEIFKKINAKEPLILDDLFVEGFSMAKYRQQFELEHDTSIRITKFSAQNAIFYSVSEPIDFSYLNFGDQNIKFLKSIFYGPVSFKACKFAKGNIEFDYVNFLNGNVDFSECDFGNGDFSFKNARFKEGTKNFEASVFGRGQKLFMNTEFGKGDVIFTNIDFHIGKVSFKVARFGKGKVDFSHSKFGKGDISFEMVEFGGGIVQFRSTVFEEGNIDFTRCDFGDGQKNFVSTNFGKGTVSFVNTAFCSGKVTFKQSVFNGDVDFHYSMFGEDDIIFDRAVFKNGIADFRAVDFNSGKISFYRTEFFSNEVVFEGTILREGFMHFRNTIFGQGNLKMDMLEFDKAELQFEGVNFQNDTVSFKQGKINSLKITDCQLNNFFDLRILKCNSIDLSHSIIRDIVDIRSSEYNIEIGNFNITGIRLLGKIYIDWKKNFIKDLIYKQEGSIKVKSEQFRILKENYNSIGEYNYEDEAYVEFKRTELKTEIKTYKNLNIFNKALKYPSVFFRWLVFDKSGLYATNPIRVLLSMLIIYIFFSLIYISVPLFTGKYIFVTQEFANFFNYVGSCFYFSGVTFFTIGYGDLTPHGIYRGLAVFEGFVGVFMMSYFAVAFVRKILR